MLPFLLAFLLLLLVSPPPAAAQTEPAPPGFYQRGAEGWFWHQDPLPEIPEIPEKPEPTLESPLVPAPAASPPTPPVASPAAPPPLSAAWFRANLERYRDAAVDDPTPAKVAAYYYLQRVMLDKANRFSDAAQQVVLKDPWLDENVRRPLASFAAAEQSRQAGEAREQELKALAASAGLWFFFRSDCPYCHLQATVLELLERLYGFSIYPISVDGAGLPDGRYPRFARDTGQAAALGVATVPALFLARPPGELRPLGQGVLALDQLTARILSVAAEAGWIAPAEYTRTRPVRTDWTFPVEGAGLTEAVLGDPARLVEALRPGGRPSTPFGE